MAFHLAGLGTATPPFVIEQHDAASMADLVSVTGEAQSANIATLYRRSGVRASTTNAPIT